MSDTDPNHCWSSGLSTWLVLSLFGVLAVLGLLAYDITGRSHRHLVEGRVVTHDHLAAGAHHHATETPAPSERPEPGRESDDKPTYLGDASLPLPDEIGRDLGVDRPEPDRTGPSLAVAAVPMQRWSDRPVGRGPPRSPFATS